MVKRIFVLIFLCLQLFSVSAQNISVTGKVLDDLGKPLIGATILLKGAVDMNRSATITDVNGNFSLSVPSDAVLVVSFIGFETQEVPVEGKSTLLIKMYSDISLVDEVVVVGFGSQKKETVVGSIAQAKGEQLVKAGGVTNITEALTGILPGVITLQTSSQPGDNSTDILIRGKSSWNGNNPLILVDGIERDFDQIDPNEVQSVSVLKDASATAVFGVRGANGVILITTKRGTESKAKINFSANYGVKQMTSNYTRPDHYLAMELYNEAKINDNSWTGLYSQQDIDNWKYGVDPYFYPEIKWNEVLLRDFGSTQTYNVNISGGNNFIKYFTSVGYTHEGDIYNTEKQAEYDPRFVYNRFNFRSNIDFTITKTTNLSINLAGIAGKQNRPGQVGSRDGDYSKNEFFRDIYFTPGYIYPLYYENGQMGEDPTLQFDNMYNRLNNKGSNEVNTSNIYTDLLFKQKLDFITQGWSVSAKISYNNKLSSSRKVSKEVARYYYGSREEYEAGDFVRLPDMDFYEKPISIGGENVNSNLRDLYYEISTNYERTFGNHQVTALGLIFWRDKENNIAFPEREHSYVGRITYNFKAKYFAEFNGAYNGSEKFAPGLRMDFFPSGAIGWMISEEKFISDNLKFIDKLKVRYSYGQSGSDQVPRFGYIGTYDKLYKGGSRFTVYFGDPVNGITSYVVEGTPANPLLTWETATKQNLGVELDLFRRISLSADFYNEHRVNIFADKLVPTFVGIKSDVKGNIGETKTRGFELVGSFRGKVGQDFKYRFGGNVSFTENRVVTRSDPANMPEYQKQAGKPISTVNDLLTNGFFYDWDDIYNTTQSTWGGTSQIPGDIKYIDYNGDGVIDQEDKVPMRYQTFPAITYGINLNLTFKNLQLSALFYGADAVYKSMPTNMLWEFQQDNVMIHQHTLDRWTPENRDDATHPALHTFGANTHNQQGSEFTYRDAKYFRLRNLELSYRLGKGTSEKILNMSKLEFYVSGHNLFTITDYDERMDPEQGSTNLYPIVKRYNVGIRFGF